MSVARMALALTVLLGAGASAPEAPHVMVCPQKASAASGPLRLRTTFCVYGPDGGSRDGVFPSPDGASVFEVHTEPGFEAPAAVDLGRLAPGELRRVPLGPASLPMEETPFAWSSDSHSVWGAVQAKVRPGGWAASPLQLVRIDLGGHLRRLPPLSWMGQDLDRITWVGGDGLAVAEFGTRGEFYRPARPNPRPTLAFVDAGHGRVLQTVPPPSLAPRLQPGDGGTPAAIDQASAVVRPDGRLEAAFRAGVRWWVWTQGEAPRRLGFGDQQAWDSVALTPGGRRLLAHLRLSASGIICEHTPRCPRPIPSSGALAVLYDLASGRELWSLSARSTQVEGAYASTAIAPDGRTALIAGPADQGADAIALLVSISNGRVLQRLQAASPGSAYRAGFAADGRHAWIRDRERLTLYDVAR